MKVIFQVLIGFCLWSSCSVSPKPINYNIDQCSACKMIIVDERFGAELVTKKGKVFKFDAIECLIPEVIQNSEDNYAHILVTDYLNPPELIDATSSIYLISKKRPSPMGGNLSAYSTKDTAQDQEGAWYNWQDLIVFYK